MTMTTTTAPASAALPKLKRIEFRTEDQPGQALMAFDWLMADSELRGLANEVPAAGSHTKVETVVAWHDGFQIQVRCDMHHADKDKPGNLLVDELRRVARNLVGETPPAGKTAEEWAAYLRSYFGDSYNVVTDRWRKVLDRLPTDPPSAYVAPEPPRWQPAASDDDIWGGEDAVAALAPVLAPANDATPKPVLHEPRGRGFVGSKYVAARNTAETAKLIREELKDLGKKGTPEIPKGTTFKVTIERFSGGSSIDVRVLPPAGTLVIDVDYVREELNLLDSAGPPRHLLNDFGRALVAAVEEVRSSYGYNDSDSMVDHFDVAFYGSAKMDVDFEDAQREVVAATLRAVFPAAKGAA